jgi:hypothetical protein
MYLPAPKCAKRGISRHGKKTGWGGGFEIKALRAVLELKIKEDE